MRNMSYRGAALIGLVLLLWCQGCAYLTPNRVPDERSGRKGWQSMDDSEFDPDAGRPGASLNQE